MKALQLLLQVPKHSFRLTPVLDKRSNHRMPIPLTTSFNLHVRHLLSFHTLFQYSGIFYQSELTTSLESCRSPPTKPDCLSDFGNRLRWPVPDLHNGVTHGWQPRILDYVSADQICLSRMHFIQMLKLSFPVRLHCIFYLETLAALNHHNLCTVQHQRCIEQLSATEIVSFFKHPITRLNHISQPH